MEGRGLAKGNPSQQTAPRTLSRAGASSALERVREAAERDKQVRFTALLHHVYNVDTLRRAYYALRRDAAPGVDGETWQPYGEALEENLGDLSRRLAQGAYRAKPVKRTYIPKADGRQRPLGIPTLEDKVVQRATVEVLNAIYETDFRGFSYGFRPGRSPHHALDALYAGVLTRKVNWVLDADIRGFFEALDHGWLVKFVEHRIADRRVVRLIQKWLNAGVLEDGARTWSEEGTPQGGSMTPPTQSQTLPGTGPCPISGSCIEKTDGSDIGDSTLVTHARSAARASGPVRRTRESSARPVAALSARDGFAHAGPPVSRLSSPGPTVCGSGAGTSRGITRAGDDGGVHREAAGQSCAEAPGPGADHGGESQFAGHARARRLAASGAARTRRWRIGAFSTTTCSTAWVASG
jgi:hypothetical protein